MRLARVMGQVTLNRQLSSLRPGALLLVNVLDGSALSGGARKSPMPEALVVFDELGAGLGQTIGISEGGEAMMPFYPDRVPCDAYCACILDTIDGRFST